MTWLQVCDVSELSDEGGSEHLVEGRVVALFRQGDQVVAIDGMCAHQGGPLAQGRLNGNCLTCPWHGWQYDVQTGCNLLTGKRMLDTFAVEIREQAIWIEMPDA